LLAIEEDHEPPGRCTEQESTRGCNERAGKSGGTEIGGQQPGGTEGRDRHREDFAVEGPDAVAAVEIERVSHLTEEEGNGEEEQADQRDRRVDEIDEHRRNPSH
jgi:hypothetical protein